jgi:hypothetical protein
VCSIRLRYTTTRQKAAHPTNLKLRVQHPSSLHYDATKSCTPYKLKIACAAELHTLQTIPFLFQKEGILTLNQIMPIFFIGRNGNHLHKKTYIVNYWTMHIGWIISCFEIKIQSFLGNQFFLSFLLQDAVLIVHKNIVNLLLKALFLRLYWYQNRHEWIKAVGIGYVRQFL